MTNPAWYLKRLCRMSPAEVGARVAAAAHIRRWRVRDHTVTPTPLEYRDFSAGPPVVTSRLAPAGVRRLVATAERLMAGHTEFFGVPRDDMIAPDWSFDPKTGRHAPLDDFAFDVRYRDEQAIGDVKQLWELSRHQHLTVLATAYAVTGDDRYAWQVADQLKSWWATNPPLRGVHWVSGIELGIRLLSWVWIRRLLEGWHGASGLFEDNPDALHQIYHHQLWLAALPSVGSSANNHVIAEAAGQLAAACAFPWFTESTTWRDDAKRRLETELAANTFASGLNREQATEYHGLVLELGLVAAVEADLAGSPVGDSTWVWLRRMCDALAAIVDAAVRPPRQGDSDDGHGLVVDGAGLNRWESLLATGEVLFGRLDWWPVIAHDDLRTPLLTALTGPRELPEPRAQRRPNHFADAGLTILRTPQMTAGPELWCRCDGGPHGFLSIAAHAHADALSLEVRHGGVDILADPGTYCYHGEPQWRSYFRSTRGHNTLELDGLDQSRSGGPFMWTRHAQSRVLVAHSPEDAAARWCAEHDGYIRRGAGPLHRRSVSLDPVSRTVRVRDEVLSVRRHACRLTFHLGPRVTAALTDDVARLKWEHDGQRQSATMQLPAQLAWSAHRGELDPPLGWYSPGFGRKEPSMTLIGTGSAGEADSVLTTVLRFR